jgi:hypothetical protein
VVTKPHMGERLVGVKRMEYGAKRMRVVVSKCLWSCLAAAVISSTTSCYIRNNPGYPPGWPILTASNRIEPEIEGSFRCIGESDPRGRNSISHFLIMGKNPQPCDYIEIQRVGPDEIEIRFLMSGSQILKQNYKRDRDYRVKDNWIVLKSSGSFAAEDIVAGYESVRPSLSINAERDLIIKAKTTAVGAIMIIIPVGGSSTEWGRFKRMK